MRITEARLRSPFIIIVATGASVLLLAWGGSGALAVPANDDFPGATIDAVPFATTIDTTAATLEVDEPVPSCSALANSIWFSFTSPETSVFQLEVKGEGSFLPVVALWEESAFPGGGLTEAACAFYPFDDGSGLQATVPFQADGGETSFIQLGGFDDSLGGPVPPPDKTGTAEISIVKVEPPLNDNFADAENIVGQPFVTTVILTGATTEPDEPSTTCFDDPFFGGKVGNTAWYKHTATESGAILIEPVVTDPLFGFFYATIVVWTGTPGNLTEVACGATTGFEANAGETYYIQIGELLYGDGYLFPGEAIVQFALETHNMPACSGAEWSFTDPEHDVIDLGDPFPPSNPTLSPDVVEVRTSSNAEWACVTLEFADPIVPNTVDPASTIFGEFLIDTDQANYTGEYVDPGEPCPNDAIGYEFLAYASNSRSLVTPVYKVNLGMAPDIKYGFQFSTENSITIVLELEDIGDPNFNVAAVTYAGYTEVDCVLNHDVVTVQPSVMTRFGDLNCDGQVTPTDDAEVLAGAAGVQVPHHPGCAPVGTLLPSAYSIPASASVHLAGDIDCDALVTPLDALNLLREIAHVPGPRPAGCPGVGDAPLG